MSINPQQILNWIIQAVISFLFGGAGAFIACRVALRSERSKAALRQEGRQPAASMVGPVPPALSVSPAGEPPAGSFGLLNMTQGPHLGSLYKIGNGHTIGRQGSDLALDDPKVSAVHARLAVEAGECTLADNGSTNGTWVNDQRIRKPTRLRENDLIKIGDAVFMFKKI